MDWLLSRFEWYRHFVGGKWIKVCIVTEMPGRVLPLEQVKWVRCPYFSKEKFWIMEE